jgi:hypothetical protein
VPEHEAGWNVCVCGRTGGCHRDIVPCRSPGSFVRHALSELFAHGHRGCERWSSYLVSCQTQVIVLVPDGRPILAGGSQSSHTLAYKAPRQKAAAAVNKTHQPPTRTIHRLREGCSILTFSSSRILLLFPDSHRTVS